MRVGVVTKDEIITAQSAIILDLLRNGMDRMQQISDLFAAIEKEKAASWTKEEPPEVPANVIEFKPPEPVQKHRGWPKGKPRKKEKVL